MKQEPYKNISNRDIDPDLLQHYKSIVMKSCIVNIGLLFCIYCVTEKTLFIPIFLSTIIIMSNWLL
jgi:hypothetical protein